MSSLYCYYPFDGTCNLSKDADFTLLFDDKTRLKIQKYILELASPVLKIAINEFPHEGSLHIPGTSSRAWTLILNHIHPAGSYDTYAQSIIKFKRDLTRDVLKQCDMFEFVSLKEDIDRRLAIDIYAIRSTLSSPLAKHHLNVAELERDMGLLTTLEQYNLPKTEEALASYRIRVVSDLPRGKRRQRLDTTTSVREDLRLAKASVKKLLGRMYIDEH